MIKQTFALLALPTILFSLMASYEVNKDLLITNEEQGIICLFFILGCIISWFLYDRFTDFFKDK